MPITVLAVALLFGALVPLAFFIAARPFGDGFKSRLVQAVVAIGVLVGFIGTASRGQSADWILWNAGIAMVWMAVWFCVFEFLSRLAFSRKQ